MREFKPTYLYIKTHNVTGLKYFGKTSTDDPYSYLGSGIKWLQHLKKYGKNISTEILGYFEDENQCRAIAESFSKNNNIVESDEWANMIDENGLDGGYIPRNYYPMSDETKEKLSKALKGKTAWNKDTKGLTPGNRNPRSELTKEKISKSLKGHKRTSESIQKTADALRGRKRPEASEWLKGREVSDETKKKISDSNKGKIVSEETKEKIRKARNKQIITEETKEKLKGFIVVINKNGIITRIPKDLYYDQLDLGDDREFVFHNSMEGKRRKDIARMRRG